MKFEWVDAGNFGLLETLFETSGVCRGCWCMFWRSPRKAYKACMGDGNRAGLRAVVDDGRPIGVLAIHDGKAIGWCSVAPRDHFVYFQTSRTLKPDDDLPLWSVTCFFVLKAFRRTGVTVAMLKAVADMVRERGGTMLEGYPSFPKKLPTPDAFAWTGLPGSFLKAGFEPHVLATGKTVMRKAL